MIEAGHLNLGPIRFRIRTPEGTDVRYHDPAYAGFWSPGTAAHGGPEPLAVLMVDVDRRACVLPADEPSCRGGLNWALWEREDHLVICSGFQEQPCARMYCRLNRDFSSAQVLLDPAREGTGDAPFAGPLRYPLDQILSWGLLARCGAFILHASVAVKDGTGWIFAGRSGAGKSTISGLCHDCGWRILNDDRVIIYARDGQYRVCGTPWHGSGRFAEADDVPLGGIFFLAKSTGNRVEPFPSAQARMALLDVAAVPWFEDDWSRGALDAVDAVAGHVPLHRLHFTRGPEAVRAVEDQLLQEAAGRS